MGGGHRRFDWSHIFHIHANRPSIGHRQYGDALAVTQAETKRRQPIFIAQFGFAKAIGVKADLSAGWLR